MRIQSFASALVVSLVLPLALSGCKSPAAPTSAVPFSQVDLRIGTGDMALNGNVVTASYSGWLYSATAPDQKGPLFDTSTGGSPITFTLGSGSVIGGWEIGVPGMKVGGLRRLVIPPGYGYGYTRVSRIPANSTLVFEIEVTAITGTATTAALK